MGNIEESKENLMNHRGLLTMEKVSIKTDNETLF
jgi:hypothetical protein